MNRRVSNYIDVATTRITFPCVIMFKAWLEMDTTQVATDPPADKDPVCKYELELNVISSMQVYKYAGVQVCKYACMQLWIRAQCCYDSKDNMRAGHSMRKWKKAHQGWLRQLWMEELSDAFPLNRWRLKSNFDNLSWVFSAPEPWLVCHMCPRSQCWSGRILWPHTRRHWCELPNIYSFFTGSNWLT